MTVLKKRCSYLINYPQIYLILSVLCMTVVTGIAHRAPLMEAVSFFMFQMCCVILPGAALNVLLHIKQLNRIENILLCYVWGFLLNIFVYFLTVPFGLGSYIRIIYAVLAVLAILILLGKTDKGSVAETHISKGEIFAFCVIAGLFVIYLFVYSLRWAMTEHGKDFYNDLLFWIGNTIALKEKFLPIDFRALYEGYKYHYFGSMQQAVAALVTDLPVFNLAVRYSYIEGVLFLGLSVSCIIMRLIKNHKVAVFTLVLMLFSTGFEEKSVVTYIWHIYQVPMSFEIAVSFELIILMLLLVQNKEKELSPFILTVTAFSLAFCTGTKGPSGAIALFGVGVMCIYWLFCRKEFGKAIFYGTVALLCFGAVYGFLLAERHQAYVVDPVVVDAVESVQDTFNTGGVSDTLRDKISVVMLEVTGYFRYIFLVNPWTFVPALLVSVYKVARRSISIEQTVLFGMVVIGSVLGYHMHYGGDSQMYFTLAVFFMAALQTGTGVDSFCRFCQDKKLGNKLIGSIVLGILLVIVVSSTLRWNYRRSFQEHVRIGLAYLNNKPCENVTTWNWVMSQSEYQAYEWIRDNTETDAVFLSDVFFINRYQSYFYPGAFTERRILFNRNDDIIARGWDCYHGDENAAKSFKDDGVSYIIQNKYRSPDFRLSETLGENVFENEEMAVYKLY